MPKVKYHQLIGDGFPIFLVSESKVIDYLHTVVAACSLPAFPPELRNLVIQFFLRLENEELPKGQQETWASRIASMLY